MKPLIGFCVLALLVPGFAYAQQSAPASGEDTAALEQKIRDLEDRLIALEGQVRTLKAQAGQAPGATQAPSAAEAANAAPAESVAATPVSLGGAGGSAAKALNPDISMIGDFVAFAGGNSIRPSPSLEMHESELGVQAIIDPYARGDFFLTFGEQGVGVEEGYITFTALPASFVARVGKMRSAFGKVNGMHNHVLPFVDRPLVTQNLVGGEDGIDDAGFSVERIIPFPKGIFLSATGQVFRGDSGSGDELVFQSHSKSDVSTVAHLRGYKDLTESTNLELGASYARGHNELGSDFITSLYGIDATLRWKPLRRAIYNSFVARSEFIWSQRHQQPFEQRAFGMYASGEYQFKRRWFLGGRYDWSDRAREANLTDKGGSVILTYWPSEFSQVRGQYRFTDYAGDHKTNELLLQVLFSLGAHGAHPF
ncbi:MAG: TonB-dependent receptor [Terriglobales bacterium]